MKETKKTELKVGITVILAFILFFVIFGWAKNLVIGKGVKELDIKFNSVAGLEKGDAVMINGVRKGYVTAIELVNDSVMVNVSLDEDINLKNDAKFYVAMLDLMGGKKIEIYPGSAAEPLDFKKIQAGTFQGDIASTMAMLSSVQEDLVTVIREVKTSLAGINNLIGDKAFTDEVKKSVTGLKNLTDKISAVISENRDGIKKLIDSGNKLAQNANDFIGSNKDEITSTVKNANELIKNTNDLIVRLTKFSDEITNKQNNAGKILYDEQLFEDLKTTVKQAKDLVNTLINQLKGKGLKVEADVSLF